MVFLEWIAKLILGMLLDRGVKAAKEAYDTHIKEAKREETNAQNAQNYLAAQNRVDAIKSALNLLNGTKPN